MCVSYGVMVVDSSPARGRLALNAATSCCATKAPAVEAHVAAVYGVCHMGKITDRRGSLLHKHAQVHSLRSAGLRLGPREPPEASSPEIRASEAWHERWYVAKKQSYSCLAYRLVLTDCKRAAGSKPLASLLTLRKRR